MQKQRLGLILLIAFPLTGLAAYAYLGSYTRLIADDFCSAAFADRLGLLRSVWYWYLNWSGRYTAFAADWLVLGPGLGPYRYHYVVPALLFLWLILVFAVLFLYLRKHDGLAGLHSMALAGTFLFVVLLLTPDIPQSLFWWNGMRSYALPLVVLTSFVLLYQLNQEYFKLSPPLVYGLGFFLFFVSGGISETMAVAQTAFLLFFIGLQLLKLVNRPATELIALFFCLAGAAVSVIVVILSPGNAIRQALLPPPPGLQTILSISIQAYISFLGSLFLTPSAIAATLGAILAALWIGGQSQMSSPAQVPLICACLLGGILVSFACFPPGVYGYSEPPPPRVMIIPIFFLMAGILSASFLSGVRLADKVGAQQTTSSALLTAAVLLTGYAALSTASILYQQRHIYTDFAERWDQVDAQILQARANDQDTVTIPAMNVWTGGGGDPTDNPRFWVNQCYSLYYGLTVLGPAPAGAE
jgi:hypothetical protein